MHMADALVSPAVGTTMWVISATAIWYSAKKVRKDMSEQKIPLMGVLGAFIFAAQMINFSIPGTGSSGHIGGGLLLAILLGPYAAFLTISSVLLVQALFFADGGLLALGCNMFNMGVFPVFIAYPFIYKPVIKEESKKILIFGVSIVSAVIALQMGAFSVVLETVASGISALPFKKFVLFMLPIHFGIGIVEGLATASIIVFLHKAYPEVLKKETLGGKSLKRVLLIFTVSVVVVGGALSWFASSCPDGLEWSMFKTSGREELTTPKNSVHSKLSVIQNKVSFLPDYSFKNSEKISTAEESDEKWPNVSAGTTFSGIIGAVLTLIIVALTGIVLKQKIKKT